MSRRVPRAMCHCLTAAFLAPALNAARRHEHDKTEPGAGRCHVVADLAGAGFRTYLTPPLRISLRPTSTRKTGNVA